MAMMHAAAAFAASTLAGGTFAEHEKRPDDWMIMGHNFVISFKFIPGPSAQKEMPHSSKIASISINLV